MQMPMLQGNGPMVFQRTRNNMMVNPNQPLSASRLKPVQEVEISIIEDF
jgi:hypothetical protein